MGQVWGREVIGLQQRTYVFRREEKLQTFPHSTNPFIDSNSYFKIAMVAAPLYTSYEDENTCLNFPVLSVRVKDD